MSLRNKVRILREFFLKIEIKNDQIKNKLIGFSLGENLRWKKIVKGFQWN